MQAFRVMLGVAALIVQAGVGRAAVPWETGTFSDALAKAKAQRRWVLVEMTATWCDVCREMDVKVLGQPEVGRAVAASFVPLRLDIERGEGETLVHRYHVVGTPTFLVLDASGAEIDRLMYFHEAKDFLATLDGFRGGKGTIAELEQKLKAAPSDDALLLEVGTRHAKRGDARAVEELQKVIQHDPDNQAKRASTALFVLGKFYYLRGAKDYAHTAEVLSELLRRFPHSDEASQAPEHLAIAYHGLGRDADARKVLDRFVDENPKEGWRYGTYAWVSYKFGVDRARGIEMAKKGLTVEPKDPALWDKLAELFAVTGYPKEAHDAEAHAHALAPGDAYYTAQLRRFP